MSEAVSLLFARLSELADAEGAVPDDGSGIDGTWTTTVPARGRELDWNVAMNADTDQEHTVEDFPHDGETTSVGPTAASIWLGSWPAGVIFPGGGTVAVEILDEGPQSIEEELIGDVDARIEALEGGDE